jgi:hypothetical protein
VALVQVELHHVVGVPVGGVGDATLTVALSPTAMTGRSSVR